MKKLLCSAMALLILGCLVTALAFNSSTDQNCYHEEAGACNSIAWDEDYIYLAKGWFEDEFDWWSTFYSIYRIDRQSGKTDILLNSYHYPFTHIVPDQGKLYLLSFSVSRSESDRYRFCVSVSEDRFHFSDEVFIDTERELVRSAVIAEGIIYALTDSHMFVIQTDTFQAKRVYTAKTEINNGKYRCQPIYENGWVYLLDGDEIRRVNAQGESQTLYSGFSDKMINAYAYIHTEQYWYAVLDGKLYLWDSEAYAMLEIDAETLKGELYLTISTASTS